MYSNINNKRIIGELERKKRTEKTNLLKNNEIFKNFSEKFFKVFLKYTVLKKFNKNHILIKFNELPEGKNFFIKYFYYNF